MPNDELLKTDLSLKAGSRDAAWHGLDRAKSATHPIDCSPIGLDRFASPAIRGVQDMRLPFRTAYSLRCGPHRGR